MHTKICHVNHINYCLLSFFHLYRGSNPLLPSLQTTNYNIRRLSWISLPPPPLRFRVANLFHKPTRRHRFNVSAFIRCNCVVKSQFDLTYTVSKFTELEGPFLAVLSSRKLCQSSKNLTTHFVLYPVFCGIVLATKRRFFSVVKGFLNRLNATYGYMPSHSKKFSLL
jgi:hypothetical protein